MGQRFSKGTEAFSICDRCGIKIRYLKLKDEWTGLKVCGDCWDPKTALEFPTNFPSDPEALRDPRPDNDLEAGAGAMFLGTDDLGKTFSVPNIVIELGTVKVVIG